MAKKIVISGFTSTDTSAPRLVDLDRIESAGSLMLTEVAHPSSAWAAGVPVAGVTVQPNILWAKAAAVIGSGNAVTLSSALNRGTNWTGSKILLERTTKGGLHGVMPNPLGVASAQTFFSLSPADPIKTFMLANPTHQFYYSLWARITRRSAAGLAVLPDLAEYANPSVPASNNFALIRIGSNLPVNGRNSASTGTNPALLNVTSSAFAGTLPASIAGFNAFAAIVGPQGVNGSAGTPPTYDNLPSVVFYRAYLEDLTVSGRTYAAVDALDLTAHTNAFAVGGRYFGDAYTDPAAVA